MWPLLMVHQKTLTSLLCFIGKSGTLGDDGRCVGGSAKCQMERFREIPVSRECGNLQPSL